MTTIIKKVLHATFMLFVLTVNSAYKIVYGALTALLEFPAAIVETFSQRLKRHVEQLESSLDSRAEKRKQRSEEELIAVALEQLYYADNPIISAKQSRHIKNALIVALQCISGLMTYHGLVQSMSSLHYAVPLVTTFIIQAGLGYLAVAATREGASRGQKFLLVVFFLFSFSFNYLGMAESRIPYAPYAKEQYVQVFLAYNTARETGMEQLDSSSDPVAELEGQYGKIDQILSDAQTRYSDDELQKHRDLLAEYQEKKIAVQVQKPIIPIYGADGSVVAAGGGTDIEYVPDPAYQPKIEEEQDKIQFIEDQRTLIAELQQLRSGLAAQDKVTAAMHKQMDSSSEFLSEFTAACTNYQLLANKAVELLEKMGSPITIEPDLRKGMQSYLDAQAIRDIPPMPSFDEIYAQWNEDELRPAETGLEVLDDLLAELAVNNPTLLKESLDQAVSDNCHTLAAALQRIGVDSQPLTEAYLAYDLLDPMAYSFNALLPSGASSRFMGAIITLLLALSYDGVAILIGFLIEHRCVPWTTHRTITARDLMPYLYPHFRKVIMPAIRKRLGSTVTFDSIRETYVELLSEYLNQFTFSPMLVREGYTRYLKVTDGNPDFASFCAFLLTCELARPISSEDLVTLNIMSATSEGQYLLLTTRAEGWLTDLIGSAAELGYNELHAG